MEVSLRSKGDATSTVIWQRDVVATDLLRTWYGLATVARLKNILSLVSMQRQTQNKDRLEVIIEATSVYPSLWWYLGCPTVFESSLYLEWRISTPISQLNARDSRRLKVARKEKQRGKKREKVRTSFFFSFFPSFSPRLPFSISTSGKERERKIFVRCKKQR